MAAMENIMKMNSHRKPAKGSHRNPPVATAPRGSEWKPQSCGLTREELRAIVAEILG